jgi:hypothetical protein
LEAKIIDIGLIGSFSNYMLRNEKSWCSKINSAETFSSSALEDPMIWMKTISNRLYVSRATCSKKTFLLRCLSR